MRLIFLDIDGILAYDSLELKRMDFGEFTIPYPWRQEACDALTRIIQETGAKVVISSDWRCQYTIEQLHRVFDHFGIPQVIIGRTHLTKAKMSSSIDMDRAKQILDWLKDPPETVTNWVSLDDLHVGNSLDYYDVPEEHHVLVDGDKDEPGYKLHERADHIIEFLNRK